MAGKHKNRTVTVVDDRGRFHCRITLAAAQRQIHEGAKWDVIGKKLRLASPDDLGSDKHAGAATVEAGGLWHGFVKLGKDPSEGGTLTLPEFVRWVESMNGRYRPGKQ